MEGLQPVDVLIHAVSVVVLFILLRLILWRPVAKYLAARAERVKAELDDADRIKAEAEAMKAEYESGIGDLEERGREILRDSQIRAGEQAREITDGAKAQAEKIIADARERIDAERQAAVVAARQEIAQLATEMASRILRREVSLGDNLSAARDFFEEKAQ
ncbi:MAG: ATP synthase F0 subunit B [Oscillospiraceae bacterium]|jgi:F-type H+-transporting ATPase subunit b|nr:ATP synthase F0 subunit B [Oscillospiraceae bacterium]